MTDRSQSAPDSPQPPMLSIVPHLRPRPDHVGVDDMVVLARDYFELSAWTRALLQAIFDPENQPSQYGTQLSSASSDTAAPLDILRRAVAWHTPGFLPPKPIDEHWLDDARRALKNAAPQPQGILVKRENATLAEDEPRAVVAAPNRADE